MKIVENDLFQKNSYKQQENFLVNEPTCQKKF